jgi:hypothetical protein
LFLALVPLVGTGCGSTQAGADQVVCPSIPRFPELRLNLEPPLDRNERLELSVTVDGQHEDCSLTITGIGPARDMGGAVQGPSTRTDMTCELIAVWGISGNGSIPGFTLQGTPSAVEVHVSRGGVEVATGSYQPTYEPTEVDGPGCGTVPRAADTLQFR